MESSPLKHIPLTPVLLAGGKSPRMGRDKALLEFDGEPLWRRQVRLLESLHPSELLVSGPRREEFPVAVRHVADAGESRGPLSGIVSALEASAQPHVLVLAIDLPQMTAAFLHELVGRVLPGRGVVPFSDDARAARRFYEPLAAVYPRSCLELAIRQLAGTDYSMQRFVRAAVAAGTIVEFRIPPEALPLFQNFNTPEDLASG